MNSIAMGIAGEFRVMSELFLKGFNPAKSYMDNGCDIILENGIKIQIKTASKHCWISKNSNGHYYVFGLTKGDKKRKIIAKDYYDYLIAWPLETNDFYIIPAKILGDKRHLIIPVKATTKSRFFISKISMFKNKWDFKK